MVLVTCYRPGDDLPILSLAKTPNSFSFGLSSIYNIY